MRSDVNVKMEYSEDMLMDISKSNLPYGQIKERMIDLKKRLSGVVPYFGKIKKLNIF